MVGGGDGDAAEHPMYVGQDPGPWLADGRRVLVVDSLAPWMPDVHHLRDDCRVIQLGPNPLYSRFPVRNFRSDVSIATETGPGLVALTAAMGATRRGATDGGGRPASGGRRDNAADAARSDRGGRRVDDDQGVGGRCLSRAVAGRRATVISSSAATLGPDDARASSRLAQEPHPAGSAGGCRARLGMKLADPDRLVVATMGDGSYLFANPVAAHHVAEAHGVAVLTVILNNAG